MKNFRQFCVQCGIKDVEKFIAKCSALKNILFSENKKHNLTRIQKDSDYWSKHIADSLSIAQFFPELKTKQLRLADIGCGAGFPSLVLAIAFKNLEVTAIDSIKKKTDFVALAANLLGLENINIIQGRARELKTEQLYDYITARAVGEPFKIFKEIRKLINPLGKIVIYQTPKTVNDLSKLNKLTEKYLFKWNKTEKFLLPDNGGERIFIYGIPLKTNPRVPQK